MTTIQRMSVTLLTAGIFGLGDGLDARQEPGFVAPK
jgi:hypothetical protein